jgi:hypothetical protein
MTRSALRSLAAVLTAAVVVAAASLLGCASYGPATQVAVPDVKTLTGTWKGTVYRSGFEPESVALEIHDDGSYDVVWAGPTGTSRGSGKIVVSDRGLLVEGQKGRGTGTLVRSPTGDLVLNVDMILNDNSTLSAKLWPDR